MAPKKSSYTGPTRFLGANIPLELAQVFDDVRGERGISTISEGLALALALWVEENPPHSGIPKALAELLSEVRQTRATREALDSAISEWRTSGSTKILEKISILSKQMPGLKIPNDVYSAIKAIKPAVNSNKGKTP